MKEHKINLKKLLSCIVVIAIILVVAIGLALEYLSKDAILHILLNYAFIAAPILGLWWWFEKYGWRHKWIKWTSPFLRLPPDLRGRWEGSIRHCDDSASYKYVVEIVQTLITMQVTTYGLGGGSVSIIEAIECNKLDADFHLVYSWLGETNMPKNGRFTHGKFYGFTRLKFFDNNTKTLTGEYFTNRSPQQTKGELELEWKSYQLRGKFE